MSGRLEELRVVDPVLGEIARGYSNGALVGTTMFPYVPAPKKSNKTVQFGKESFEIYETERAISAPPKRMLPVGRTPIDIKLSSHALEYPIDEEEIDESIFDEEQIGVESVSEAFALRLEKKIADLAQNLNNYPTNNKRTLIGDEQWSSKTTSDPVDHIKTAMEDMRKEIGRKPTKMLLGPDAFNDLSEHPKILAKIQYVMKGIVTIDILREIFPGIEEIVVGDAIYKAYNGEMADLWNYVCILGYVGSGRSRKEPSWGYTFRKKGYPVVFRYVEPNGIIRVVQQRDVFEPMIVGPDAGYIINDTRAAVQEEQEG